MKGRYGLLLALLVVSGSALTGGGLGHAATVPMASPAGRTPGNVAVLVVDDFGSGRDPQTKTGTKDDTCTVGTTDVGSNGAGDDLPPSMYAHGELVYRVLKDELTADLGKPPVASTTMADLSEETSSQSMALASSGFACRAEARPSSVGSPVNSSALV